MGKLIDMIGRDKINELLMNKVKNKQLAAKIEENKLKSMQSLSETLAQYKQQQAWQEKGAMELSPGSEDTNVMNPEIQPVKANPQKLMDAIIQATAMSNPTVAGQLLQQQTDPKRKLMEQFVSGQGGQMGGAPNLQPGQPQQNPLMQGIQNQDPMAMIAGGELGLPVPTLISNKTAKDSLALRQKQYDLEINKGVKEEMVDETGQTKERYVDPSNNRAPIAGPETDPNGWRVSKKAQLVPSEILVGGRKIKIWTTPKEAGGVDLGPEELRTITEGMKGGGQRTTAIPKTQTFDVISEQPASTVGIVAGDLPNWLNEKGEHPKPGTSPKNAEEQGFTMVKPLTGSNASWFSASVNAVANVKAIRKRLFDKEGKVDRKLLFSMKGMLGNPIPGTEGELYASYLISAKEAQIRSESGAAIPLEEITRMAKRYVTNIISQPETINEGLNQLENVLGGFISMNDPTGTLRKIVESKQAAPGTRPLTKTAPRKPGESIDDYINRTEGK